MVDRRYHTLWRDFLEQRQRLCGGGQAEGDAAAWRALEGGLLPHLAMESHRTLLWAPLLRGLLAQGVPALVHPRTRLHPAPSLPDLLLAEEKASLPRGLRPGAGSVYDPLWYYHDTAPAPCWRLVIPAGALLTAPLLLHHLLPSSGTPAVALPRLRIEVGAGSRLFLEERWKTEGPPPPAGWLHSLTEITVGEGAQVYHLHHPVEGVRRPWAWSHCTSVALGKKALYHHYQSVTGHRLSYHCHYVELQGEGSRTALRGSFVARTGEQSAWGHHIRHCAPSTWSDQHYCGAVGAGGSSAFTGRITVGGEAQGAQALQQHHARLLHPHARCYARPQLAIQADQVQCTHKVSMEGLDESVLAYLQNRGITPAQARYHLAAGFLRTPWAACSLPSWQEGSDSNLATPLAQCVGL